MAWSFARWSDFGGGCLEGMGVLTDFQYIFGMNECLESCIMSFYSKYCIIAGIVQEIHHVIS
jgi:hypothetical protein